MEKEIEIISVENGSEIVLINDVYFKSRRNIKWNEIEKILKKYIGRCYEILSTSEQVYIGSDFPDEYCHSKDTRNLKGANEKAKANAVSAIGRLIQVASKKAEYPDYQKKHGSKAQFGWYRYDTKFGIPVYNENEKIERYNVFEARLLIRRDGDGKNYLYDIVRIKKETSKPLEQKAVR